MHHYVYFSKPIVVRTISVYASMLHAYCCTTMYFSGVSNKMHHCANRL
jgi:hypothetical protein